jgi:hypothetical protein
MKEFEIAKIGDDEGVDMGSIIKNYLLLNVVFFGGTLLSFNVL